MPSSLQTFPENQTFHNEAYNLRKKVRELCQISGKPWKSCHFIIQNLRSPCNEIVFFFIFARLPSSNYIDQVQKVWSVVEVDAFSEGAIKLLPKLQLKFSKELIYDLVPVKPSNTMNVVMK